MIDFRPSSDCKTVITWQGEHCEAVVDIGTVDATSAVQLRLLMQKLNTYQDFSLSFNGYMFAIVRWTAELYATHDGIWRDDYVAAALKRVKVLSSDIAAYNHHCAIMETAEEAKAA